MGKNSGRGFFLTLEGGEGAGKSSLLNGLEAFFHKEGYTVVKTREPGGSELGNSIRSLLLNPQLKGQICARSELLLFLAARAQHVEELIEPALQQGHVVICDRFHDSTLAYQGLARGLGFAPVKELCLFSSHGLCPDLTLYLDISPELGLQRIAKDGKRSAADRIESEEIAFHECVRRGFLLLAEQDPERIVCLNAALSESDVLTKAIHAVKTALSICKS